MAKTKKNGLEFDPGFGPFILAFQGTVNYLYTDINRFKNLSQKKMKFMMYYKKILEVFYNNIGFYAGCLMWAVYLKSQPEQEILSNSFYGKEYNEQENLSDIEYLQNFVELFPKDMKYFMGKDFSFEPEIQTLISSYKEFLKLNKGFTITKNNTDILLPESINTENSEEYKNIIDSSIKAKNLNQLSDSISMLYAK